MPEFDPKTRRWSAGNGDLETAEDWKWILLVVLFVGGIITATLAAIAAVFF